MCRSLPTPTSFPKAFTWALQQRPSEMDLDAEATQSFVFHRDFRFGRVKRKMNKYNTDKSFVAGSYHGL